MKQISKLSETQEKATYSLNGIVVPDWAAIQTPNEIDVAKVLSIENTEARREVMKKVGIARLFSSLKTVKLDAYAEYELYEIEIGPKITGTYLAMINHSTAEIDLEGVPDEIMTCKEALAWRRGIINFDLPVFKT